jgi:hypothetical protein
MHLSLKTRVCGLRSSVRMAEQAQGAHAGMMMTALKTAYQRIQIAAGASTRRNGVRKRRRRMAAGKKRRRSNVCWDGCAVWDTTTPLSSLQAAGVEGGAAVSQCSARGWVR